MKHRAAVCVPFAPSQEVSVVLPSSLLLLLSLLLFIHPNRRLPGVMTQQMQNLQLSQTRKCPGGPASPSAAKRLYRNLSEKLRGSTSSFEDAYFFGKTDRLRKTSVSVHNVLHKVCLLLFDQHGKRAPAEPALSQVC